MTDYVFAPPAQASAAVEGNEARFPVRRIICVGRNYGAHVHEMGGNEKEHPPIFFAKPADAVRSPGDAVPYPPGTNDLHHEIELVVALKSGGADLSPAEALACVYGYAAGVDLTRRDLQGLAKKGGQPWDAAKGFDASAPIGLIRPNSGSGSAVPEGNVMLSVDGETKQDAPLSDMIWSVAEIIAEASKLWTLAAGDLIFTGTPEGVGPVARGQKVEGKVADLPPISFTVS